MERESALGRIITYKFQNLAVKFCNRRGVIQTFKEENINIVLLYSLLTYDVLA